MPLTPRGIWYPDGTVRASTIQTLQQLAESVDGSVTDATKAKWAMVRATAPQAMVNGAFAIMAYSQVVGDTDGMWNPGSSTTMLTCQTEGVYLIGWTASFAARTGGSRAVLLRVNGNNITRVNVSTGNFMIGRHYSTPWHLRVGDYVQIVQYQSSSSTLETAPEPYPTLSLVRIGDA